MDANKSPPCKTCCGSASTRFSGSTGFPTTPPFNETVELAKQNGFGAQAGFVNAVLRGYLREADATKKLLDELKITQPALGWSHPEWLVARWQKRWGTKKRRIAGMEQHAAENLCACQHAEISEGRVTRVSN